MPLSCHFNALLGKIQKKSNFIFIFGQMIEDQVLFHLPKFGKNIFSLRNFPDRLKWRDEAVPQKTDPLTHGSLTPLKDFLRTRVIVSGNTSFGAEIRTCNLFQPAWVSKSLHSHTSSFVDQRTHDRDNGKWHLTVDDW